MEGSEASEGGATYKSGGKHSFGFCGQSEARREGEGHVQWQHGRPNGVAAIRPPPHHMYIFGFGIKDGSREKDGPHNESVVSANTMTHTMLQYISLAPIDNCIVLPIRGVLHRIVIIGLQIGAFIKS